MHHLDLTADVLLRRQQLLLKAEAADARFAGSRRWTGKAAKAAFLTMPHSFSIFSPHPLITPGVPPAFSGMKHVFGTYTDIRTLKFSDGVKHCAILRKR